ncbi:SZT2 (predicted) [Pycnogonum litorale]
MNPEKEPRVEEAQEVYLILKRDYRISRNIRAQWYLNNLNKTFQVKNKSIEDCTSEIDIISVTPSIHGCNSDVSYLLTPSTDVVFLFHQYRLIFCLDLSPSTAAVDIQHGEILYNEVLPALAKCLTGLTQPFHIPGSKVLFQPQIFVTVVAHMPFLNSKARQILVQGWQVSAENLNVFMEYIEKQLMAIETSVVESTKLANKELNDARMAESSIGKPDVSDNTFDGNKDSSIKNVLNSATVTQSSMMMMTPATHDCNLVNMLRYGIFAVQLLPENSCAGIIIITDGMLGLPDVSLIDSLLTQLRNSSVSCSFLQVGSQYHPYSCYGLIPNTDLMQFIAKATLGTHIHVPLNIDVGDNTVNVFHKMSILWSFQRKLAEPNDREPKASDKEWSVRNHGFYSNVDMSVLRKKQSENTLEAPLQNILSCRLREGYTIKDVTFVGDNQIEVKLVFPWRPTVNIEYLLKSVWPLNYSYMTCHYEITIEGNYDFLHDVTCLVKKPVTSPFRANVVKKYWQTLQSISQTDQLLARLCSFASNPVNYTVPDSNKNGVPLFFVPPNNSNTPVPCCSDNTHSAYSVFSNFWKPMCMLDISIWQKWMHTHSIGILLEHDMQLPKYLHQPNSTGRYNLVQCRQAIMSVHRFLRDWSSFVLIENHSYIKLIFREKDKPPVSFYIIRVTTKAPCMVIRLAFLGGMSGFERNKVVQDLKDKILSLNFPQRAMSKEPSMPKSTQLRMSHRSGDGSTMVRDKIYRSPLQRAWSEINCCVLMHKPVEKMIVRYERIPVDFKSPVHMMELDDNRRTNSMNTSSSMAQ